MPQSAYNFKWTRQIKGERMEVFYRWQTEVQCDWHLPRSHRKSVVDWGIEFRYPKSQSSMLRTRSSSPACDLYDKVRFTSQELLASSLNSNTEKTSSRSTGSWTKNYFVLFYCALGIASPILWTRIWWNLTCRTLGYSENKIKRSHLLTWALCFFRHYTSQPKYDSTLIFFDNLGKYFKNRV